MSRITNKDLLVGGALIALIVSSGAVMILSAIALVFAAAHWGWNLVK